MPAKASLQAVGIDYSCFYFALQPVRFFQPPIQKKTAQNDADHYHRITVLPIQLRHVSEVHTVPTENHGGYCQDRSPTGQSFDNFVLPNRFKCQMHLHCRYQHFSHTMNLLIYTFDVIHNIAKIDRTSLGINSLCKRINSLQISITGVIAPSSNINSRFSS